METLYKYGKGWKTWRELLQELWQDIDVTRVTSWCDQYPKTFYGRTEKFFFDYVHNVNDGGHWVKGTYEKVHIGYDEENRCHVYENGDWIPPHYVSRKGGWCIQDNYGRIIPSGYLKDCIRMFKPAPKPAPKRWYYRSRMGTGTGHRNGWWHKYDGDHGNNVREIKYRPGYEQLQKETLEEYGITFNLNRRNLVDLDACCYHFRHRRSRGGQRGWKRTRKEKQWMRGDVKRIVSL